MGINIRKYGNIIANLLYNDSFSVTRLGTNTNKYGATVSNGRSEIYTNKLGKFSFDSKDAPADANDAFIPMVKEIKLFTSLDLAIIAGDKIIGYRTDPETNISQLVTGICGEPNRFDTHQEIPIQQEEEN